MATFKRRLSPKLKFTVSSEPLGRYTGNAPVDEPVGVVHGQEYVVSEPVMNSLGGKKNVEAILAKELDRNGAPGFQLGGTVDDRISTVDRIDYSALRDKFANRGAQTLTQPVSSMPLSGPLGTSVTKPGFEVAASTQPEKADVTATKVLGGTPTVESSPTRVSGSVFGGGLGERVQPTIDKEVARLQEPDRTPPPIQQPFQPPTTLGTTPTTPTTEPLPVEEQQTGLATVADQAIQASTAFLQSTMAGENPFDRKVANATLGYLNASNAAERSAYQQELAQMGLSPSAAAAHMALLGRQQRSEESGVARDLALGASERALGAAGTLGGLGVSAGNLGLQRDVQAFAEEKYGDAEGLRMANDALSGMGWETFNKKYPDATREDFGRMSAPFNENREGVAYERAALNIQAGDYAGANKVLADASLPSVDFTKMAAGEFDSVIEDLSTLIGSLGPDADPATLQVLGGMMSSVMAKQWDALGISPESLTITAPDGKTVSFASLFDAIENPEDASESAIAGLEQLTSNQTSWLQDTAEGENLQAHMQLAPEGRAIIDGIAAGDEDAAEKYGHIISAARALSLGLATKPQTDLLRDLGYLPSEEDATLDLVELDQLGSTIQERLNENNVQGAQVMWNGMTDAQKEKLQDQFGFLDEVGGSATFDFGTSPAKSDTFDWNQSHMGKLHRRINYNSAIYNEAEKGMSVTFNDEFKSWAKENAGNKVTIDGVEYIIDPLNPIEERKWVSAKRIWSGNDKYTQRFYADGLRVIDPKTQEETILTFDTKGDVWD